MIFIVEMVIKLIALGLIWGVGPVLDAVRHLFSAKLRDERHSAKAVLILRLFSMDMGN